MANKLTIVGLGEALWDVLPSGPVLGGAPLNAACHAAQMLQARGGCGVVASRVGRDPLGDAVVRELERRGMSAEYLQRDSAHATSTVQVEIHNSQPTYIFAPDIAWDHLHFTPEWAEFATSCDAVCFGTLAQRSPQSRKAIWQFLDAAPQAIRLFDVNLRQGFYDRESISEGCRRATLLKLNEHELAVIAEVFKISSGPIDGQLCELRAMHELEAVVFTRGERGTLLVLGDQVIDPPIIRYPAAPNADAVGAGDACSAGILVGWLLEWPPARIAAFANRLGAFVASQPGATPELPLTMSAEIE